MSYKILVMSPLHQTGTTTVSTLISQGLTWANKSTTLVYTDAQSNLPKYLGLHSTEDPTRSVMQITRLIDNGALNDKEILDYTVQFSKNAHLMSFGDSSVNERDTAQIVKHIFSRVPTDICVVDCNEDIDSKVTQSLIKLADMILIVISPSHKDYTRLKYWLSDTPIGKSQNVNVVVNHYDEVLGSVRSIASYIGLSANRVCKIHENAWIRKCCLSGQLHTLAPKVMSIDNRVANLSCDFSEITQCVITSMLSTSKFTMED